MLTTTHPPNGRSHAGMWNRKCWEARQRRSVMARFEVMERPAMVISAVTFLAALFLLT